MRFFELVKDLWYAMAERIKNGPLWLKYLIVLVLIAGVAAYIIFRWGVMQQVDTEIVRKLRLEQRFPDPRLDNLWFLPDGTLVGTLKRTDEKLVVCTWNPRTFESEYKTFDIPALISEIKDASKGLRPLEPRFSNDLQLAVMRDGSKAVIYFGGYLALFRNNSYSPLAVVDISREHWDDPAIPILTVTDNGLIALANSSGQVEFRSEADISKVVGVRQTKLSNPSIMKPLGNLLAIVSIQNASVVILDVNSVKETPSHGYPPTAIEQFTLAISPKGRLAIGKGDDEVRLTEKDGSGDANISLRAYGNVKALSFVDESSVVAGGDFRDVYVLEPGKLPYSIGSAPQGINALAVNANRIAYAGNDGVVVLSHTKSSVTNLTGKITAGVFTLVLLGMMSLYFYDKRKRQEDGLIPTPAKAVVQEEYLPLPEPPDALVKALRTGECVLYAGAGVSAQANFPTWQSFIKELTRWTIANGFTDARFGQSLQAALDQELYDSVADNLVSIMRTREPQFNQYLREIFEKRTPLPASLSLLKDLPFTAALTTNFDNLLERAFANKESLAVRTPKDAELLLEALHKRQFFLLKLYGMLDRPDTVMIAPAQYDDVVKGNLQFSQFMQTLLFSRTLFFVGSSLEGIQAYLKEIALPRQNLRTHYALVAAQSEAWQAKAYPLKERYGIEVLPYSPTADHPEVQRFLDSLNRRVKAETERTKDEIDTGTALKKIVLSNIGPFDSLELKLDPRWNILLGDNGVGKSSVVKSIATAILGQDSAAYAGRLIKSGKTQSVITLETGRNTYTTTLSRKNGEAKVESIPGRPFEGEGWLAVGFPPLRTVSWARPKAPEAETKGRPTPDDLLPVITGEPDPRLDKLKQWIVNIDYWIKDAQFRGNDSSKYERLLKDFFSVVATLTKGTKIEFKEVKPQTNEVTVITDDGELPIESLSQGMTSLIGWVGILLQRLYEVYGAEEDPKQHYALVLMDEIDAHLHPAWQQSLIGELGKIFPHVQFIATTHSPLIVGGMQPNQIMRFARDDDQKVVVYKVEEEMTIGRADQILTSDLFGLKSTFALNEDLEALKKEYDNLFTKIRNEHEEVRFQRIRETLKVRIPMAGENPPEQKAKQLIRALLADEGDGKYESVTRELLNKAEQLLNEVGKTRR
jgi:hypothetical protein